MEVAGWILILSGVVWIFYKTWIDSRKTDSAPAEIKTTERGLQSLVLPGPEAWSKLVAVPYGVGISMILIGAILLLAASGINLSFGPSSSSTPSPSPT